MGVNPHSAEKERKRQKRRKKSPAARKTGRKGAAPRGRPIRRLALFAAALATAALVAAMLWRNRADEGDATKDRYVELMTTGYCNCGQCCGWKTDESGRPVYSYGMMSGKPKTVGLTSSGKQARPGTIAADPRRFKTGTRIYVPGYGLGRVEDIGGAIKGDHIDLWFPTHKEALEWGVRRVRVLVLGRGD